MPIQTMKPEKAVPRMLNHLNKAIAIADAAAGPYHSEPDDPSSLPSFKRIQDQLKSLNDLLPRIQPWERTLTDQFTALERQIARFALEPRTQDFDLHANLDLISRIIDRLNESVPPVTQMPPPELDPNFATSHKYQPKGAPSARKFSREWSELRVTEERLWTLLNADLRLSYDNLDSIELKLCLLCFVIFPENSFVKKRPLIYWWIGEGLIKGVGEKTAEEVGEEIFQKLIERGLIFPCNAVHDDLSCPAMERASDRRSPGTNGCKMHPWIRRMLISVAREANFFNLDFSGTPSNDSPDSRRAFLIFGNQKYFSGTNNNNQNPPIVNGFREENLLSVFNINEQYIEIGTEWLSRLKMATVLQLGRWQLLTEHHIEVENEDFLKGLGAQKHLKYLSLRGISRITELPSSVSGLMSLEILDLRACYNLEKLPSDIGSLKRLTHLDVSECYLLESMPKGIEKLSNLQVLKGFIMGNSEKTPCKLRDLANLKKLRRLSIHIGSAAIIQDDEFGKVKDIDSLRCLTISWGVNPKKWEQDNMKSLSFPPQLEKLDLRGIPQENKPEWLKPSGLKSLKKLYIRGGEFCSWDDKTETTGGEQPRSSENVVADEWKVEILLLKYLKNLKEAQLEKLRREFHHLLYWEVICEEVSKDKYNIVRKGDPNTEPLDQAKSISMKLNS